jgi:hypothetical protein
MVRLSLLSICTAAILQLALAEEVSPPVQIEVQAPWTTSNLGLEILQVFTLFMLLFFGSKF